MYIAAIHLVWFPPIIYFKSVDGLSLCHAGWNFVWRYSVGCVRRAICFSYQQFVGIFLFCLILMLLFCIGSWSCISTSEVIVATASFLDDHVSEVQYLRSIYVWSRLRCRCRRPASASLSLLWWNEFCSSGVTSRIMTGSSVFVPYLLAGVRCGHRRNVHRACRDFCCTSSVNALMKFVLKLLCLICSHLCGYCDCRNTVYLQAVTKTRAVVYTSFQQGKVALKQRVFLLLKYLSCQQGCLYPFDWIPNGLIRPGPSAYSLKDYSFNVKSYGPIKP